MPIYRVVTTISHNGDPSAEDAAVVRLVDAKNQAKAFAHVAAKHITLERATPDDLITCTLEGVKVEKAED